MNRFSKMFSVTRERPSACVNSAMYCACMSVGKSGYGSVVTSLAFSPRAERRALSVVGNGDNGVDWPRVAAVVRDWRPNVLLVGLPLMLDGSEQANSRTARAFAAELGERYKLPVHLVDERLSSVEASQRFAERRASGQARRKNANELDAIAAQVIIETWLKQRPQ